MNSADLEVEEAGKLRLQGGGVGFRIEPLPGNVGDVFDGTVRFVPDTTANGGTVRRGELVWGPFTGGWLRGEALKKGDSYRVWLLEALADKSGDEDAAAAGTGGSGGAGGSGPNWIQLASERLTKTFTATDNGFLWGGTDAILDALPLDGTPNDLPVIDATQKKVITLQVTALSKSGTGYVNVQALGLLRADGVPYVAGNLGNLYVGQPAMVQADRYSLPRFPYWQLLFQLSGSDTTLELQLDAFGSDA